MWCGARAQKYLGEQGQHGGGAKNWVSKWTELLTKVFDLPAIETTAGQKVRVSDHVLVDILNEPDYMWIRCKHAFCVRPGWGQCGMLQKGIMSVCSRCWISKQVMLNNRHSREHYAMTMSASTLLQCLLFRGIGLAPHS